MTTQRKPNKWSQAETKDFIAVYGNFFYKLQEMGPKRPLYEKIALELSSRGYELRDWSQLQKKVNNLREKYKKFAPGPTGGKPSEWDHYDALHKIWHEQPALNENVVESQEVGLPSSASSTSDDQHPLEESQPLLELSEAVADDGHFQDGILEVPLTGSPASGAPQKRGKKRPAVEKVLVRLCEETLEVFKKQKADREEEKRAASKRQDALLAVFERMAKATETIAGSMAYSGNQRIPPPPPPPPFHQPHHNFGVYYSPDISMSQGYPRCSTPMAATQSPSSGSRSYEEEPYSSAERSYYNLN